MLQVEDISVNFGGLQALQDVTLTASDAQITGLIGPNGAGKTTLFNVITGMQRPGGGTISLDGTEITGLSPQRRALRIGRTFQRLELFGSLTVQENVLVALEAQRGRCSRGDSSKAVSDLLALVGADADEESPSDILPTGKARLVELARALACRPRLLLLDEISSGLDIHESQRLGQLLRGLASDGMAILLVEHDMDLVMSICEKIYVLDFGRVISAGTPEEVTADDRVRTAYLGDGQWDEPNA